MQQQPVRVRDLMFKSIMFKIVVVSTVILFIVSGILSNISTSVTCKKKSRNSCDRYFYYATNVCYQDGGQFCCGTTYDPYMPSYSCGSYNYCYYKPQAATEQFCIGLVITARVFNGLSLLMLLMLLVTICHFRRAKRRAQKSILNQQLVFSSQQEWLRYQQYLQQPLIDPRNNTSNQLNANRHDSPPINVPQNQAPRYNINSLSEQTEN